MISGLILQTFTILSGFILPKIILTCFGSEVNGLVSSLNQFLSYISLVEGGITGVVMANLYKPIVEKDEQKISAVMVTANRFFKKIGILFVAYSVGLSIVYPLLFKTEFNFAYVCSLTLILSITVLVQYMFSITLKTLLDADKRVYVVNFTQTLIVICNVIFAQISVWVYPSIHILKLISGILFILQPVIFGYIVKRDYRIDWSTDPEYSLIKSRWSGFAINLAAFIHGSTDITILTILTNLKTVSVYSVYGLVSNGIKALVQACLSGLSQTVGQAYAKKDWKELNQKLDLYEYVVFVLVFFIFTVTALLINPFIQLYTRDVTDANYNQPIFGILLIISEGLYLVKFPHLNLAYAANKFKEITVPAYIEALLNIVISVILVHKFGLVGVAKPMNIFVNTFGRAKVNMTDGEIAAKIWDIFDMRPKAIEERLKLRNPIYFETASYGHMGRKPQTVTKTFSSRYLQKPVTCDVELFTWEKLDYADKIKDVFGL